MESRGFPLLCAPDEYPAYFEKMRIVDRKLKSSSSSFCGKTSNSRSQLVKQAHLFIGSYGVLAGRAVFPHVRTGLYSKTMSLESRTFVSMSSRPVR